MKKKRQHLSKARSALGHAREYFQRGEEEKDPTYYEDSVEQLCKAIHQAANALFLTRNLDLPKTPKGVTVMLWEHFMSEGLIDRKFGRLVGNLHQAKDQTFYGLMEVSAEDVEGWTQEVEEFIQLVAAFVRS